MMTYNTIKAVCEGLLANYDKQDADYIKASEDEMLDEIIELFASCYDAADFLKWLADHDGDILIDYRFSDTKTYEEIAEELDNGNECDGVYDIDFQEWEKLTTEEERKNYIKDHLDCLMSSDRVVVISW